MDKIKTVFFDIDNTLYDSTLQSEMVRRNAMRAMIEAGLQIDEEKGLEELRRIVKEKGSNFPNHFDVMLKKFGIESNPRIIAAGIVAYHTTKAAYLVPYPDTIPTLLELRDRNIRLGVITEGRPVKQWEKLIRLGLQHFFHTVVISEEVQLEKPSPEIFKVAAQKAGCKTSESMMVGDRLDKDIIGANLAGMTTVQLMKGKYSEIGPACCDEEPDYVVPNLREALKLIKNK
jgi:putative hydrolase of the HAD superfamily